MSEHKVLKPDDFEAVLRAFDAGKIVGIPTDASYGLAARLDRPEAIRSILELAECDRELSLSVLIGRWGQVKDIAMEWSGPAFQLGARFWPGPLTLVVPVKPELDPLLGNNTNGIGLRHPKHRFLKKLCITAGPLVVMNTGGDETSMFSTSNQVVEAFSGLGFWDDGVVVDAGDCNGTLSTVVDCTGAEPECVREGAIDWMWIEAAIYRSRQRSSISKLFKLGSRKEGQSK